MEGSRMMSGGGVLSSVGRRASGDGRKPLIVQPAITKGYRDLIVWQKAIDISPVVYSLVKKLPPEERFGMADQIRRACVSVAANIAEGQARESSGDFARFLRISRGSLAELDTIFAMAHRVGYFSEEDIRPLQSHIVAIRQLLQRLIQSLERSQG